MASNTMNPAALAAPAGLGKAVHVEALSGRDITRSTAEIQTNFLMRRHRLSQTHARLIADLAFRRAA